MNRYVHVLITRAAVGFFFRFFLNVFNPPADR